MSDLTYVEIAEKRQIQLRPVSKLADLARLAENVEVAEQVVNETVTLLLSDLPEPPKPQTSPVNPRGPRAPLEELVKKSHEIFQKAADYEASCGLFNDPLIGRLLSRP